MDEKVISVRREKWYDLNAIDSKTKYVLAHRFVDERTLVKCVAWLRQIKRTCYAQMLARYEQERRKPRGERRLITFVSDKFWNYRAAWSKLFFRVTRLEFGVPIARRKHGVAHNNNPVERYNQDLKDQTVTKRHFGSGDGARTFFDLRRIIKNFVNPHQQLCGQTPAEAAGINLDLGRQKLLRLIVQRAQKRHHSLR